jgi:hypothetical protein
MLDLSIMFCLELIQYAYIISIYLHDLPNEFILSLIIPLFASPYGFIHIKHHIESQIVRRTQGLAGCTIV